jgi:hypothetical protein
MDQTDVKPREREPWTDKDSETLMKCWYNNDPVLLISIKLKRTPSSIQTQASRKGLPARNIDQQRHRKRWSPAEDTILDQIVYQKSGFSALQAYAVSRSRTLDAIVSRLISRHGQGCLESICAGAFDVGFIETLMKTGQATSQPEKFHNQRKCMNPDCRQEFVTPDRRAVWHCPKCRRAKGYDD